MPHQPRVAPPTTLERAVLASLAVAGLSCSHLRASDETVAEHRNDAAIHAATGRAEQARYDASATERPAPRTPGSDPFGIPGETIGVFNPSSEHLANADREFAQANDHLVAARSLLAFEHEACAGQSEAERSSCPLFATTVSVIELTDKGFTLVFQTRVDVDQTWRRLTCHLAYATATGFDHPSCPLFLKGLSLQRVGPNTIGFNGDTEVVATSLRAQARRLFLGLVATKE